MTEELLAVGRNAGPVVRVGGTVRRPRDPGSDFAARLLAYLESAGYPYAPRFLGVDERGRDILSFIPGRTTDHPSQRAAGAYARGGAILRRLHDVTAGHPLAAGQECEPAALLGAMTRSQARLAEVLAGMLAGPGQPLPAERRRHAEEAIAWAVGCRDILRRHEALFLAALRV